MYFTKIQISFNNYIQHLTYIKIKLSKLHIYTAMKMQTQVYHYNTFKTKFTIPYILLTMITYSIIIHCLGSMVYTDKKEKTSALTSAIAASNKNFQRLYF